MNSQTYKNLVHSIYSYINLFEYEQNPDSEEYMPFQDLCKIILNKYIEEVHGKKYLNFNDMQKALNEIKESLKSDGITCNIEIDETFSENNHAITISFSIDGQSDKHFKGFSYYFSKKDGKNRDGEDHICYEI